MTDYTQTARQGRVNALAFLLERRASLPKTRHPASTYGVASTARLIPVGVLGAEVV